MANYTDANGRVWHANEIAMIGVGARAEGDHYPEPTHILVQFESDGEVRLAENAPSDWLHPERIDSVFTSARVKPQGHSKT